MYALPELEHEDYHAESEEHRREGEEDVKLQSRLEVEAQLPTLRLVGRVGQYDQPRVRDDRLRQRSARLSEAGS